VFLIATAKKINSVRTHSIYNMEVNGKIRFALLNFNVSTHFPEHVPFLVEFSEFEGIHLWYLYELYSAVEVI
jgi:hypothetical protein